jgi:hypothetical protein
VFTAVKQVLTMRRLLPVSLACALLAGLAVPAFGAPAPPRARATLERCHPALAQADRFAVFGGTMRSLRQGLDRMDMRFDLYRRAQGRAVFRRVVAPGLGVWNHAEPGVLRFRFRQRVENLSGPAAYRVVASFRWLDALGSVFVRASHITPACQQPDSSPSPQAAPATP